ncbi:pro-glucagon-like isoform X1 [Ascaphus truei]|uniref:pro-glucagon-like isoform X1 n=2 Tax=Ascaphus truei TaxID=8439 RepID=UPI003F597C4C
MVSRINMKSIYCMVGILFMLLQGSWQNPLQETEDKSRSVSRRNAAFEIPKEGSLEYDEYKSTESKILEAFIDWLAGGRSKSKFKEVTVAVDEMISKYPDGSFAKHISNILDTFASEALLEYLKTEKLTEEPVGGITK